MNVEAMNLPQVAPAPRVRSPEEELLNLLATQARRLPIAVFAVLALIAVLVFPYSDHYGWAMWLAAVIFMLAVRYIVLTRLPGREDMPLSSRINVAAALSALNGVTHASSLFFFPLMTDIEQAIQSLVLAGLGTAAVATTAGDRKVYLCYFLPIFPTLIALWAFNGSWSTPTRTDIGLALSITVFSVVMLLLARDTNRQFIETIRIRKEQEALNERLQDALAAADVADRAKTRFLASASHDLRQPIHALSLFGAALKMQNLPDNVRELANNIDESISVLASQLDALLDISRLDAGVVSPDIDVVDLTSMLERVAREFRPQVEDKRLELRVAICDGLQVSTDKLLLERVIRNLLNNAIRYTQSGEVSISTRTEGENCILAVADTGIGIPESEQGRIFSEFYQVSQRYGDSKQGLGLGLSIVTRLLALLDAPLDLASTPGEGTRIEITLRREGEKEEAAGMSDMIRLEGVQVLVIDDDSAVRKAMTALLAGFGAETRTAATLAEAIEAVEQRRPDLVLSDLRLGVETGIEAIARIREVCDNVPAILITGDTGTDQIQQAHETGLELLHKPVNPVDLERKISQVIHKH